MMIGKRSFGSAKAPLFAVLCAIALLAPGMAFADEPESAEAQDDTLLTAAANESYGEGNPPATVSYDYDAGLYTVDGTTYPGVYATKVEKNDNGAAAKAIGMPSIADANLPDAPTTESPAIINGAAVGYEEKTGPTDYTKLKDRDEPYEYFKYSIIEEQGQDGTTHKKLSGFDGTYVITRVDVTNLFDGSGSYLHVKQDDNRALLVAIGMTDNTMVGTLTTVPEGETDYKAGSVYKTGSYKIDDMRDQKGSDKTPFLDVIVFATAANVAGADAGKQGALNGDIPLSFYVDDTAAYNDTKFDPQSTDPNHIITCLEKFYDASKVAASAVSRFIVKGSDLALETMVENSDASGAAPTYWSLTKAMEKPYYDQEIDKSPDDPNCGRTVKLMSEVAIVDSLDLKGADANNLKKRTLDVNSFDVQVAKNSQSDNTGFTITNAWLTIEDMSKTTGAEVAIGNNAKMVIDQGGKLIVDETCQLEVEWDGGTTTPGQQTDALNNGAVDLRAGGELVNNGVISIEGTEGKPYQPGQQGPAEKGYGEFTILPNATLTNNGTIIANGRLYNLGTLVNNGRYDDVIWSNDPDKGMFAYHRGIQVGWKDDVTQPGVKMGELHNGHDRNGNTFVDALLKNIGDILLAPGKLVNYATLANAQGAHIYLAAGEEAIIPIEPDPAAPTVVYKRITLDPPVGSVIENYGTIINCGEIVPATVEILDNGGYGKLTVPGNHPELFKLLNYGKIVNCGYIWGWGSHGLSANALPKTGDPLALWAFVALVAAACSATVIFVLRRREDRR